MAVILEPETPPGARKHREPTGDFLAPGGVFFGAFNGDVFCRAAVFPVVCRCFLAPGGVSCRAPVLLLVVRRRFLSCAGVILGRAAAFPCTRRCFLARAGVFVGRPALVRVAWRWFLAPGGVSCRASVLLLFVQ